MPSEFCHAIGVVNYQTQNTKHSFRREITLCFVSNIPNRFCTTLPLVKSFIFADPTTGQCDVRKVIVDGGHDCMLDPEMKANAGGTYWFVIFHEISKSQSNLCGSICLQLLSDLTLNALCKSAQCVSVLRVFVIAYIYPKPVPCSWRCWGTRRLSNLSK